MASASRPRRWSAGLVSSRMFQIATLKGAQPGHTLILIGETKGHLGASLYAREILGLKGEDLGPPPPVDLETRNAMQTLFDH